MAIFNSYFDITRGYLDPRDASQDQTWQRWHVRKGPPRFRWLHGLEEPTAGAKPRVSMGRQQDFGLSCGEQHGTTWWNIKMDVEQILLQYITVLIIILFQWYLSIILMGSTEGIQWTKTWIKGTAAWIYPSTVACFFVHKEGYQRFLQYHLVFCLMIWHKNLAEFGEENRAASERIESQ